MDRFSEMEAFVRVVEDASFSAAARRLRVTPSAVSRMVGHLEGRLDVRLINRTTRRLSLTDEGHAFYARAARILADVDAAEQATQRAGHAPFGILRIHTSIAFGTYQVAPLLPPFLERHPGVRVELTLSDRMGNLLEEGADVGLHFGGISDSSLISRKLAEDRMVVCASPGYLERFGTPVEPDDLRNHSCLTRTAQLAELNIWTFRGADGPYRMTVSGRVEVNNSEALLRMALSGVGVARVAGFLAGPYVRDGRLRPILADFHTGASEPVCIVYPHRRHVSARVRAFVDYMVDAFTPVPPWTVSDETG